jgi:predicted membrane protein
MDTQNRIQNSEHAGNEDNKKKRYFRHRPRGQGHAAGGIILIIVGVILLLANFDIITGNVSHYLFNWKTFLIILGIIFIGAKEKKTSGYILLGLGVIFWLPEMIGDYYITFKDVFWPSILILIGLALISRHRTFASGKDGEKPDGYLNDISVFSGGMKIIKSECFRGGNLTAIFGGSEFDLRQVKLDEDGAVIDVVTIFGGTKFIVPEDWNVYTDTIAILGGVSDKRPVKVNNNTADKTLIIKGVVIFGGVEIKSF